MTIAMRSFLLMSCLIMGAMASISQSNAEPSSAIWFSPPSNYPPREGSDLLSIFSNDDGWREAGKKINVFKLSTTFLSKSPMDVMEQTITMLQSRGIALAIEGEIACSVPPGTPELASKVVDRLKSLGGELSYVAIDEPFWWDVESNDRTPACHLNVDQAVQRVANVVNVYIKAFPKIHIGDIEPFPALQRDPNWEQSYQSFISKLEMAIGRPLEFLHVDLNWRDAAVIEKDGASNPQKVITILRNAAEFSRKNHLKMGMIYNGRADATSDASWVDQAKLNAALIDSAKIDINDHIFQSWNKFPLKSLPDSDGSTLMGFLIWYTTSAKKPRE